MAKPATVTEYLESLPKERRLALTKVRAAIRKNLPKGYVEGIQYGMIGYFVPHAIYPAGYRANPKEPVPFINVGSQKNYMVIHAMCLYADAKLTEWFTKEYAKSGKKLDMGKGCVRFKELEDLPLDVLGALVAKFPVAKYIKHYEAAMAAPKRPTPKKK